MQARDQGYQPAQSVEIDPRVSVLTARARAFADSALRGSKRSSQGLASASAPELNAESIAALGSPTLPNQTGNQGTAQPFTVGGLEFGANVPKSLIGTESGGNWDAENDEVGAGGNVGHFGILQFGPARLADAAKAGIIPADMTPQQFKRNRNAQVAVSNWHFNDIDTAIARNGFDQLVGQDVGGVNLTMNGMRAIAHLGGSTGLERFIRTNGQYNPADAYGTTLAAYGRTHR